MHFAFVALIKGVHVKKIHKLKLVGHCPPSVKVGGHVATCTLCSAGPAAPPASRASVCQRQLCFLVTRVTLCYSAGLCDSNESVCLSVSVRPSVRLSVTRLYCVKMKKASIVMSSLSGSPIILVF